MKWFSNLLRKPTGEALPPPLRSPATPAAKTVIDIEGLRRTLAVADSDDAAALAATELGRALAAAAQSPRSDDLPVVWAAAISYANDRQLAHGWLDALQGDVWLGEIAARGRIAEIRLAAAQRIDDPAVLERVAHDSRDKDKRVYRHCADLLRQRRRAVERARRGVALEAALAALLEETPLPLSDLMTLEKELKELQAGAAGDSGDNLGRCAALLEQARIRLQQEANERRDLQLRQADAATLLAECKACAMADADTLACWQARFAELAGARRQVPAWLSATGLETTLVAIEARLAALAADIDSALAGDAFLATLTSATAADAETVAAWNALPKPVHAATRQALEGRWQALCQAQPSAPAAAEKVAPVAAASQAVKAPLRQLDQAAMQALLDQLEQHLDQGHLADADAVGRQIDALTAASHLPASLDARLQHAHSRLGEMRGWARWSTLQARDRLIASAEELASGTHGVDDLAVAVPALREEWKRLNAHGPSAKSQWESFDAALEKAFLPVTVRRAEDAARQAEARAARETLCAEWEAWLAGIDWPHADHQAIELRRQEILNQWRDTPHAGYRDERVLRKRLDKLIATLDAGLDEARGSEIERREQIIAAAEALRDLPDPTRATNEAKALQERWRAQAGTLRLKRGDEQKLWQRFRAACDAAFARRDAEFAQRDAQRAEQVAQRQQRRHARQALLDAFAATLAGSDARDIKAALASFRSDWQAQRSGPRESTDALDGQARELQQQAQRRLDDLRRQKIRAAYELLARKAQLAAAVEAAALAGSGVDAAAEAAREAWAQLPRLRGGVEAQLGQRLSTAIDADGDALANGRVKCDLLLVDLEIALGLPSPPTRAEQRRLRQMERLQDRFGGAGPAETDADSLLTRWYATAASTDPEDEPRLVAVVEKLVEIGLAAPG